MKQVYKGQHLFAFRIISALDKDQIMSRHRAKSILIITEISTSVRTSNTLPSPPLPSLPPSLPLSPSLPNSSPLPPSSLSLLSLPRSLPIHSPQELTCAFHGMVLMYEKNFQITALKNTEFVPIGTGGEHRGGTPTTHPLLASSSSCLTSAGLGGTSDPRNVASGGGGGGGGGSSNSSSGSVVDAESNHHHHHLSVPPGGGGGGGKTKFGSAVATVTKGGGGGGTYV